jgi:hypothetical protein
MRDLAQVRRRAGGSDQPHDGVIRVVAWINKGVALRRSG